MENQFTKDLIFYDVFREKNALLHKALTAILRQEGREEHEIIREMRGLLYGYDYLKIMTSDENAGLLDHEIVQEVSRRVLQTEKRGYSQNLRVVEYKGKIKTYVPPRRN